MVVLYYYVYIYSAVLSLISYHYYLLFSVQSSSYSTFVNVRINKIKSWSLLVSLTVTAVTARYTYINLLSFVVYKNK